MPRCGRKRVTPSKHEKSRRMSTMAFQAKRILNKDKKKNQRDPARRGLTTLCMYVYQRPCPQMSFPENKMLTGDAAQQRIHAQAECSTGSDHATVIFVDEHESPTLLRTAVVG